MIIYSFESRRFFLLIELGYFNFFSDRFFVVTQFATIFDMRIISNQTAEKMNLEIDLRHRVPRGKERMFTRPMTTKNAPINAAQYRGVCSVWRGKDIGI